MRRAPCFLIALASLLGLAADTDKPTDKDKKADLGGAFHPFNVTGFRKGHFHCLVSAHGLNQGILLFSRDLEFSDTLKELLKRLDNAVEKNPNVRLGVFAVFVPDDLEDVLTKDDKREEYQAKLEKLNTELMLKHVVLAITHKGDLKNYKLEDNAVYTVLLYHKLFVLANEAIEKDKLTREKIDELLKLVGDKLGATRK